MLVGYIYTMIYRYPHDFPLTRQERERETLEFVWCSDGYFWIPGILSIMASFVILSSISDTTISNQYISSYTHVYIYTYIAEIFELLTDCSISHTPTSRRSKNIPGAPRGRRCGVWLPLLCGCQTRTLPRSGWQTGPAKRSDWENGC